MYVARIKPYNQLTPNTEIKIALRLAETDSLKASEATEFKSYMVKPISESDELFESTVSSNKEGSYEWSKSVGKVPYKFHKRDSKFEIERYNYATSTEPDRDNIYVYTYAADNWDKENTHFEYMFVPTNMAFYGTDTMFKTDLTKYFDIVDSNKWVDYNNNVGLTEEIYSILRIMQWDVLVVMREHLQS